MRAKIEVLHRVGVLEFVDQRRVIFFTDGFREGRAAGRRECVVEPREQVVEGENVAEEFALLQLGARPGEKFHEQGDGKFRPQFLQTLAAVEDFRSRRRTIPAHARRDHAGRKSGKALQLFDRATVVAQAAAEVVEKRQHLFRLAVVVERPRAIGEKLAQLLLILCPTASDVRERDAEIGGDLA